MTKPVITLRHREDYYRCDDCGVYATDSLEVLEDGDLRLDRHGNDHLPAGTFGSFCPIDAVQIVLESLGYEVKVERSAGEWPMD